MLSLKPHATTIILLIQLCCLVTVIGLLTACIQNATTSSKSDGKPHFNSRVGLIFEDSKGHFWFTTQKNGMCYYNGKECKHFTKQEGFDEQVRAMEEDSSGRIHFATSTGISIWNGKNFTHTKPPRDSIQMGANCFPTKQLWKKQLQGLWFSAFNQNGVYCHNGEIIQHLTLPVPPEYPIFDNNGYNANFGYDKYAVYGIYKDTLNAIWLGTAGAGLYHYNGVKLTHIKADSIGVTRAIHMDKMGRVWFGNNAIGVCYHNGKSVTDFSAQKQLIQYGFEGALAIEEDHLGNLWFATFDAGLWCYKATIDRLGEEVLTPNSRVLTQYTATHGLNSNYVSALHHDSQNRLWVGTGNGGIFIFDGKKFHPFIQNKH